MLSNRGYFLRRRMVTIYPKCGWVKISSTACTLMLFLGLMGTDSQELLTNMKREGKNKPKGDPRQINNCIKVRLLYHDYDRFSSLARIQIGKAY